LFCVASVLVAGQKGKANQAASQDNQMTSSAPSQSSGKIVGGGILSRQPTPAAAHALLDANDAILLLLDHQTGLFQTVKDVPLPELRNNAVTLAKIAQLAGVPIITTASEPNGSNGPLMDELSNMNLTYVARKGEVSAWDNADFVAAVEASGRKTLIIAGVWTSVCVAFPAIQAKADGYRVYAVMDASGDISPLANQVTLARIVQAGVVPVTSNVILCEFQRTWNRPDALSYLEMYNELVPNYKAVGESYLRAQQAALGKAPTVAVAQPTSKPRGL